MTASQPQSNYLPASDLELLSAYIDGQLTAVERRMVDQRLAAEPQLRGELDELRSTAQALRALPTVTPPRSFTIDATQLAPRRFWLPTWVMQFSSGLSALALVVLTTLGVLSGSQTTMVFSTINSGLSDDMANGRAAATAAPAAEAAATMAPAATEAPAAMSLPESAPAASHSDGANTDTSAGAAADSVLTATDAPIAASESSSPGTVQMADEATKAAPSDIQRWPYFLGAALALLALLVSLWGLRQRRSEYP
jgi:anti-sigma factor RsiW